MTDVRPHGLHHVTAIATDPQANVDFYTSVLGLRLVKQTVNFDAPETYHLYYGDEHGSPSSLLTFFPWPGLRAGRQGAGSPPRQRSAFRGRRWAGGTSDCSHSRSTSTPHGAATTTRC